MNALLQYLAHDEPAVRLPTSPRQYKGHGSSPYGVSPPARAPRAETSEDQFASWRDTHDATSERDQEFLELLVAYRASGGLARTHEVIGSCKRRDGCDTGQLARWIVTRQIISIHWQNQTWIPWFQFDPILGQPRSPVGQIARELCSVLDELMTSTTAGMPNNQPRTYLPMTHSRSW